MTLLRDLMPLRFVLLLSAMLLSSCGDSSHEEERLTTDFFTKLTWKESQTLSGDAREMQEVHVTSGSEEGTTPVVDGRWSYRLNQVALGENLITIRAVDSSGNRHELQRTLQRYSLPDSSHSVGIIAHRGASLDAPENTLAAVHLAWRQGANVVEVDTRLSSDKKVMVIHDESTWKTSSINHLVEKTPSSVLRRLDVGRYFSDEFYGERIPFLEEVIDAIPPGKKLLIEMKTPEMTPFIKEVVAASGKASQIAVHTFYLTAAIELKRSYPELDVLLITDTPTLQQIGVCFREKLTGLSVRYQAIDQQVVQAARNAGLVIYAWVVTDPVEALAMMQLKVNGILTDRPGDILAVVSR